MRHRKKHSAHRTKRARSIYASIAEGPAPKAFTPPPGPSPSYRVCTIAGEPPNFIAVIEYNMHPVVPGRGSGIFLHVQIGKATSGCVGLPRPALVRVLRWLRRDALPQIAIGTTDSLRQARRS